MVPVSRLVGLPVAAVLTLAGCGGGSGSPSGDASGSDPASSTTTSADVDARPAHLELRVVSASSDVGAPDSQVQADFEALECSRTPTGVSPTDPLTTCDDDGVKYALDPAAVSTLVATAVVLPAARSAWAVNVTLDDPATGDLAALTRRLARTREAAAIVVDGLVRTTSVFATPVRNGRLQIEGSFTEDEADRLADALLGG